MGYTNADGKTHDLDRTLLIPRTIPIKVTRQLPDWLFLAMFSSHNASRAGPHPTAASSLFGVFETPPHSVWRDLCALESGMMGV